MNETRPSQAPWLNQAGWHDVAFTGHRERFGQPAAGLDPATGRVIGRVGLIGAQEVIDEATTARDARRAWAGANFENCDRVLHTARDRRPGEVHPVERIRTRGTPPANPI